MDLNLTTKVTEGFKIPMKRYFIIAILAFCSLNLFAEGTRELVVNTTFTPFNGFMQFDTTKSFYTGTRPTTPSNVVQIWDQGPSAGGLGRATGSYTSIRPANEKYRVKIRVCKVGEVINLGFNPANDNLMFWRLYKPDGTPIRFNGVGGGITNLSAIAGVETVSASLAGSGSLGPNDFTYRVPRAAESAQPGYIFWYSQAAVGAFPACSTTTAVGELGVGYPIRSYCGYRPIQYVVQPGDIGPSGFADFFIVFNGNDPINEQKTVNRQLAMFDVTVWDALVVTPTQPVVRKARMFSAAWDINCNGLSNPQQTFNSRLYFYSSDSVVSAVRFNQMRPYGFVISANKTGCANTGNSANDRRSRIQYNGAPDYPIFLNNPFPTTVADRTCGITPKASFGNIVSASITGCDNDRCINLTVDKAGTVGITLMPTAANPNAFVPRIFNNQTFPPNVNTCIPWDGKDGAGNQIVGPVTVQVNYFNGLTNLPLYDVEIHQFGYLIDLIAPTASVGAKPILVYWEDRPPAGSATLDFNAGQAMDGLWDNDNNPLTADIVVGYQDLDPVNAFQAHSTYNLLGCDPLVDHSAGTAGLQGCHLWQNRGLNSACPGNPNCAETHNTWWNANVLEVTVPFVPSNVKVFADQDAAPAPVGTGNTSSKIKNVCSTVNPIPINGVVKVDINLINLADANDISDDINGPGRWSLVPGNASGSFGSAVTNLVNTYIPTAADYARGFALIVVTSDVTAQTPCGSANDTLRINLFQGPDVWARANQTVCANNALVALDPGIVGDSSGKNNVVSTFRWTPFVGGVAQVGGTFVPNNQSLGLSATYTPPASFTSGVITMRIKSLTTTLPGTVTCPADSAQFTITVNSVPIVNALDTLKQCNTGAGTTVAVPVGQATINGGSSLAGFSVNWTGNGSFTGNGTLTPTYTPTAAERALGVAKIVFNVTKTSAPSCAPVRDTLIIGFITPPTANAGPALTLCSNNITPVTLRGVATNFTNVSWTFSNTPAVGGGSFSVNNNDTTTFTPSGTTPTSTTFTMTVTKTGCPSATSSTTLTYTPSPTVTSDGIKFYCLNNPSVKMNYTLGGSAVTGEWFANKQGTIKPLGTFAPNDKDPNATYTFDNSQTGSILALYYVTTGNGNCLAAVDSSAIFPNPDPTIALVDRTVCQNNPTVTLTGPFFTGAVLASSIKWTSLGTTQTFAPNNTESTVFTPSAADISAGSVKLVLEGRGIASGGVSCSLVSDTMLVTFSPAPTVNAGPNHNVCANNPTVTISGTTTPAAATHTWSVVSGVAGTFGNASNLTTTFTASSTPAAGSNTVLRLTATLAGCNPVSSLDTIFYTPSPTATITTAPGSVCKNNATITLTGTSSTGALHWSSGTNCASCFSDTNAIAPATTTYIPSAADLAAGFVDFTINTRNNGNCVASNSSVVRFTFINSPTVTLKSYGPVCENNATINLTETAASLTGATGGTWTSSSGCASCFGSTSSLTTTYTPSITDIANGSVTFTLTSTGNVSNCAAAQQSTTATITKAPVITAGPDLTVCTSANTVALSGATSSNTSSVSWAVKPGSGTGTITNSSSLNGAIYNITATDKTNGTAIVVLTGNGNAGCSAVTQERVILFNNASSASVGPDKTVCQNDAPAVLDAFGTAGGTWTCAGCAAAITSPGQLTASYNPVAADINQTRAFTYTVPAIGACPGVSASLNIRFNPAPTVSTGGPWTLCGNSSSINLTGSFLNATGVVWTTSGTGSFGNQLAPVTTYTPSSSDTSGAGVVTLTLTTTGSAPCSPVLDSKTLTITKPIVLNAGSDQNKCGAAGTIIPLSATLSGGATFNTWSIVGPFTGTLNNPTSQNGATYTVGAGDAGTTIVFQASSNATASCLARTDQVSYNFIAAPVVTASSAAATFCQNRSVTLNGTITNTNTGTWSCTNCAGTGTFSPDNTYNNLLPQTSVQFTPAPADTSKASLNFILTSDAVNVCGNTASTVVTVNLEKAPKVNAGPDRVLCANNNVYTLAGSMTNSATGVWKAGFAKVTGFSPSNAFPAALTYDPDTADVQLGFVTLTLFSTGTTFCPSDSDKVTITFSQSPIANAGLDRTICKNNGTFNLAGSINPGTGFNPSWSSPNCGVACFSSPNALVTNYTLNATDTIGASLQLFLTATDPTGLCSPDRDTVVINLTSPPSVDITSNFPNPICTDSLFVNLAGVVSSGGFNWSSNGSGTFQANAFQPAVVYPFTAADRAKANLAFPNNQITIYLSTDNGFCKPVKDSVKITLTPSPVINITTGDSITICGNQTTVNLAASVSDPAFTIDWTTSGAGTFSPDPTASAQTTTYTVNALDVAAQVVVLVGHTISPVGNTCKSVTDQYKLKITPIPVVNAGADVTVCQSITQVDLSDATVANSNSNTWTTSGGGVFGIDNTTVGAGSLYYPTHLLAPGTNDVDQPSITLTLTAIGCTTVQDTRIINFTPAPTAAAGADQTVCNEATNVALTGVASNGSSVNWRVQGSAVTFASTAAATYNLTAADKAAGFVNLVFTVNGNGSCSAVTDTIRVTIRPQPTISIGPDAAFCSKTTAEILAYNFPVITMTNGITPTWTTTGTAANLDASSPLFPTYVISATDITNGSVTIRATTRSAIGCAAVSDAMVINIAQAPTLTIGPDISACAGSGNSFQLGSSSTNSSGTPSWATNKGGVFDDPNISTPIYTPALLEDANGNTTRIFATINGQGSCPAVTDSLDIVFTGVPPLADLKDTVICFTNGVSFDYAVSTGLLGNWTTTAGAFLAPGGVGVQNVILQHTPVAAGSITITFTPSDACFLGQTVDGLITLVEAPRVTVTSPLDVCINNFAAPIALNSNPTFNGAVAWTTVQGFGSIGASGSANTTYTLNSDSSDFSLDSILVKITVQGTNAACKPAEDTVAIRTHLAPVVSSIDQTVCSDLLNVNNAIQLNGTISAGFSNISWTNPAPTNIVVTTPTSLNSTATVTGFPASLTLSATGLDASCAAVTQLVTINSLAAPTFATAGTDIAACSNGNTIDLDNANMNPSLPTGVWSKQQAIAGGSFTPNNTGATGVSYIPSAGDIAAGSINLIYKMTNTGVCTNNYADTVLVTFNTPFKITASTTPITFCAQDNNVNLGSTISPAGPLPGAAVIAWSRADGLTLPPTGVFVAPTNTLNTVYDPNPSNIPNGGDVGNGGAILKIKLSSLPGCPDDSDFVSLILVPEPAAIVNAGSAQQVCVDRTSVQLQGLVINAAGGIWRTTKYGNISVPAVAATGIISDSLDLEADYFFSAADRAKPSIRLYLYSSGGNSLCSQVIDSVDINFTPRPVPSAVASATSVCADVDSINLTGSFTVGGINGIWTSSGDGVFTNIGIFDPTPIYIPGPSDIAVGSVIFTYSSNNFQDCQSYSAKDTTIITPKIVANAGPDLVVCGNNTTGITLSASSPPTNTGVWSVNGILGTDFDGTFSQINALQATYIPGDKIDPVNAAVSFKFKSTGGAPCKPDSSQMILKIAPSPTVRIATNQQTVCNDVSSINVNVTSMTVATSGFWTTSGTGSFANATALSTTYNFSSSDLDSTSLTISFITSDNISAGSQCNPAGDALTITLNPKPVVTALAANNCVTSAGISLNGSSVTQVGNLGVSGIWSSNPAVPQGQFSLDQFIDNGSTATTFFPSTADVSRGTVTLTLSSAGAGTCKAVSRSVTLNVSPTPIADAGKDLFVCSGSNVSLSATPKANLVGYSWQDITTPGAAVVGLQATDGPINNPVNYVLTVTDNKGCTNTDTVAVNAVTDPLITQQDQLCYDFHGFVNVNIGGVTSPLGGFQWFYNGALMSGETRDSVRITQPGLYQVRYSLGACTNSSDKATNVLDLPRITTPDYIGCKNSTVTATVNEIPNTQLSGLGLMPFSYTWNPGGATTNPAVLPTSVVNPNTIDTIKYAVTSSYTTAFITCTYRDTVAVISIPRPVPALIDSAQACAGTPITLNANQAPSNLPALAILNPTIEWYTTTDSSTILDNDAVFTTITSNYYKIRVTIGQCIGRDSERVDMRPYPSKILPNEVKQCFEQVGLVTLNAGPGATGTPGFTGITYAWSMDGANLASQTGSTLTVTYPMIQNEEDEELLIISTKTNSFNSPLMGPLSCANSDTTNVRDVCAPRVFPPTAFHPGDGNPIDGEFTIKGKYYKNFKITVYSRWGEVIFYSEDQNKHWDGTYRGELMPVGVYAYIITYEGKDETTKGPFKKEGRIVLLR